LALCLAPLCIDEGLYPILTYRSEEGKHRISDTSGRIGLPVEKYGVEFLDFAERGSIDSLFTRIGHDVDLLVDFAQGDVEALVASVNPDLLYGYFSENIAARAEFARAAAQAMLRKKRGRIVFISSGAAARSSPGLGFYAAAKLASEAIYRNLGTELGSRGITTVTLRPWYIVAGRGARFLRSDSRKNLAERAISPEQAAEAILFFLSENSRVFNAVEIMMDGGLAAVRRENETGSPQRSRDRRGRAE